MSERDNQSKGNRTLGGIVALRLAGAAAGAGLALGGGVVWAAAGGTNLGAAVARWCAGARGREAFVCVCPFLSLFFLMIGRGQSRGVPCRGRRQQQQQQKQKGVGRARRWECYWGSMGGEF